MTMWWERSDRYVISDESQLICLYVPQNICIYIYRCIYRMYSTEFMHVYIYMCVYMCDEKMWWETSHRHVESDEWQHMYIQVSKNRYIHTECTSQNICMYVCVWMFCWWKYVMRDKSQTCRKRRVTANIHMCTTEYIHMYIYVECMAQSICIYVYMCVYVCDAHMWYETSHRHAWSRSHSSQSHFRNHLWVRVCICKRVYLSCFPH